MQWLAISGYMKTTSFPLSSHLWRNYQINCSRSFSSSKRVCSIPHLYGPHLYGPMLMTVSIGSRKRIWKVHTVGYPVVLAGRPQRGQEELGWKTYLDPRDMGTWTVRKTVPNGGSSRKAATPISSGWFPRHSGRAEFTPDPIEILIHFFKKQALLDVVGF